MALPYYSYEPSEDGLTLVDTFEREGESWQFDLVGVWKDEQGAFYWAMDSGCSCPTPFEGHDKKSLDRLTLDPASWKYFEETVSSGCRLDPTDFLDQIKQKLAFHGFKLLDYRDGWMK